MCNEQIRNVVLSNLKKEEGFKDMVFAELNGEYFSAADIAIPKGQGEYEVYRVAIVKHFERLHA